MRSARRSQATASASWALSRPAPVCPSRSARLSSLSAAASAAASSARAWQPATSRAYLHRNLQRRTLHASTAAREAQESERAEARERSAVLEQLHARGLVQHITSSRLDAHLARAKRTIYLGLDPTAASLHAGNLLALCTLLHFSARGHRALALVGGATGAVGDPSGRRTERAALDKERLQSNIDAITRQVTRLVERGVRMARKRLEIPGAAEGDAAEAGSGENVSTQAVEVVNNAEWISKLSLLDFLADTGKLARVSVMLARESVRSRLGRSGDDASAGAGLSFTEFSYMLLQAHDFAHLNETRKCTIQLGGSDQLGNIQAGIDLIRRRRARASGANELAFADELAEEDVAAAIGDDDGLVFGLTIPLMTTASGEKFGKSAGNAVWLDAAMTSPFELYQFFLRADDKDVARYLRSFTFLPIDIIERILRGESADCQLANGNARSPQEILAAEVVELVHGATGLAQALLAKSLFFARDADALDAFFATTDRETVLRTLAGRLDAAGEDGDALPGMLVRVSREEALGKSLLDVLVSQVHFFKSATEGRKALQARAVRLNSKQLAAQDASEMLSAEKHLIWDRLMLLRHGKGKFMVVEVA